MACDECRTDPGCRGRAAPDRPGELEAVGARAPAAVPVAGRQLFGGDPANHRRDQHRRGRLARRPTVRAAAAPARSGRGGRRGQHRDRGGRHGAQFGVRRLRAHHDRPLRPDAGAVSAAGRRAADLRAADPRRGQRPRPRGADHAAGGARPADPARAVGQLAVLERAGHRVREHPLDHLAALAERRRDRAAALGRRVRPAARRPDQHRCDRRREDGLLRRPPIGPRTHPGAAHLRRVPDRRRRDPDRRPVPRVGPRRRTRYRQRPALRPGAAAGAPGGDLAGRARRAVRRPAGRHPPPQAAARRAGGPGAAQAAPAPAGGARRLGRGQASWPRRRSRAATRPTGNGPPTPNAAGSPTWSSWWSPRRTVRPRAPRRPWTRPRSGATGSAPATRRSARAVGPGRCIGISSSTTAAPARPSSAPAPRRAGTGWSRPG